MDERKTFGADAGVPVYLQYAMVAVLIAVMIIGSLGGFRGESKRHGVNATTVAHEKVAKN